MQGLTPDNSCHSEICNRNTHQRLSFCYIFATYIGTETLHVEVMRICCLQVECSAATNLGPAAGGGEYQPLS